MEVYPAVIDQENQRYGPFLATTTLLMESVKAGAGREAAHEAIKTHAVQTVRDLREGKILKNDLVERLASDKRLGLGEAEIKELVEQSQTLTGQAKQQVESFCAAVCEEAAQFPEAANYQPEAIL